MIPWMLSGSFLARFHGSVIFADHRGWHVRWLTAHLVVRRLFIIEKWFISWLVSLFLESVCNMHSKSPAWIIIYLDDHSNIVIKLNFEKTKHMPGQSHTSRVVSIHHAHHLSGWSRQYCSTEFITSYSTSSRVAADPILNGLVILADRRVLTWRMSLFLRNTIMWRNMARREQEEKSVPTSQLSGSGGQLHRGTSRHCIILRACLKRCVVLWSRKGTYRAGTHAWVDAMDFSSQGEGTILGEEESLGLLKEAAQKGYARAQYRLALRMYSQVSSCLQSCLCNCV